MSTTSAKKKSVISLIVILLISMVGFGLGYMAMTTSGDIRSRAAEEDYVVKKWEFDSEDDSWVGTGLMLSVAEGKLKTRVNVANTAKISVSNAAVLLTRGKKKIALGLAVTYPDAGEYTFRLRWKAKNGKKWSAALPVKGTANGAMQNITIVMPNTLSNFVVDSIELQFAGAPKEATIDVDYVRAISTKTAGTITKVGKLDATNTFIVTAKEKYALTAGAGVSLSSYTGKSARVTGKLGYSGSNFNTPTITVTAIENTQEEVVLKDWGFADNDEWSASNAKVFMVEDGALELTVGSDGTANISHGTVNLSLPSGKKKITFDAAVTMPANSKPVFTLLGTFAGANTGGSKVEILPDGNEHTYEVDIPAAATMLKTITLRAANVKEDTVISIGSMNVSVVKSAGTMTKVGKLSAQDNTYTLTVTNKEIYRMVASGAVNLSTYADKYVRATGTLGWSSDGKTPILTISSIEAAEEEVSAMEWLFNGEDPYDTEGWYANNLTSLYLLGGNLRAGVGSAANPRVVNNEVNLLLSAGQKRVEIAMSVTGALATNPKFTLLALPTGAASWQKYAFAVTGEGEHVYSITLPKTKVNYQKLMVEFTGGKQGAKVLINSIRVLAIKPAGTIIKTGNLTKVGDEYVLTVKTIVNKDKVHTEKFILAVPAESSIVLSEYVGKNVDVNGKRDNSVTKSLPVISVLTIE